MTWNKATLATLGLLALSGCMPIALEPPTGQVVGYPVTEEKLFHENLGAKENTLEKETFSIELVRLEDTRSPENFVNDPEDNIIYEYRPEQLTRGLAPYMQGLLGKSFEIGKKKDQVFLAEVDITNMRTLIKTGTFMSGKYGRYAVVIDANVVIRDKGSQVVLNAPIHVEREEKRSAYTGRHPNAKQDEKRLLGVLKDAGKEFAIRTAWEVRQVLNGTRKYYDPQKEGI